MKRTNIHRRRRSSWLAVAALCFLPNVAEAQEATETSAPPTAEPMPAETSSSSPGTEAASQEGADPGPPAAPPAPRVPPPLGPPQFGRAQTVVAAPNFDSGLLIELSTAGLASAELLGGIFLGYQAGPVAIGAGFDYSRVLTRGDAENQLTRRAFVVGLRLRVLRAAKGRVECIVGAELGHTSQTLTVDSDESDYSASGGTVGVGPGLRVWVLPGLALGYQTRFSHRSSLAIREAVQEDEFEVEEEGIKVTETALNGRFTIFGVF